MSPSSTAAGASTNAWPRRSPASIRVSGTLAIVNAAPLAAAPAGAEADALRRFLASLAADERYLLSTGLDFTGVIAARIR